MKYTIEKWSDMDTDISLQHKEGIPSTNVIDIKKFTREDMSLINFYIMFFSQVTNLTI